MSDKRRIQTPSTNVAEVYASGRFRFDELRNFTPAAAKALFEGIAKIAPTEGHSDAGGTE